MEIRKPNKKLEMKKEEKIDIKILYQKLIEIDKKVDKIIKSISSK